MSHHHLLGLPVVYHAHDEHKRYKDIVEGEGDEAKVVGREHIGGCIHHDDHHQFSGLITAVHTDSKTVDLVIFPPNKIPTNVDGVAFDELGNSGHSWHHVRAHHLDELVDEITATASQAQSAMNGSVSASNSASSSASVASSHASAAAQHSEAARSHADKAGEHAERARAAAMPKQPS